MVKFFKLRQRVDMTILMRAPDDAEAGPVSPSDLEEMNASATADVQAVAEGDTTIHQVEVLAAEVVEV